VRDSAAFWQDRRALPAPEHLSRRIDRAEAEFMLDWLRGIPGVRIERFGEAWAPVNPDEPELDFQNRVIGLYPKDAGQLDAIVAYYREAGVRPWFELPPAHDFERLAGPLIAGGARPIGFQSVLYAEPERFEADARVREIGQDEAEVFADVLLRGHGVPDDVSRSHVGRWAGNPSSRLYLAEVDGVPAAAGALVLGEVANLANASTLPEFRGRGLQSALIRARIDAAAMSGAALVCASASWDSQSQRNLERAGLRVAYTKTVWRVQP
jgi:GNAT superfamily N-acetyltransferase